MSEFISHYLIVIEKPNLGPTYHLDNPIPKFVAYSSRLAASSHRLTRSISTHWYVKETMDPAVLTRTRLDTTLDTQHYMAIFLVLITTDANYSPLTGHDFFNKFLIIPIKKKFQTECSFCECVYGKYTCVK